MSPAIPVNGTPFTEMELVLGCHAGASRLGEWLDQETGVVGVLKRRPRPVGIEKAVEGRGGVGRIKERGTHNQYGQQQIRKFGEVRLHGPHKAFLLFSLIWRDSPGADYANSKNASGGMVADQAPEVDIGGRDG